MARNNKRKIRGTLSYSIIVDGKTEVWYFQMMKKYELLPRIDIVPEIPKKKSLREQYETVREKAKIYDKVFWIIDLDIVIKEDKERKKGSISLFDRLRKYKKNLIDNFYGIVEVIINNPCLEFWYLLHYHETSKHFANCDKVTKELKQNHLTDYEKTERYYKKKNDDIYKRLKPYQPTAKVNAAKLGRFSFDEPEKAISEMNKVLDLLSV